MFGRFFPVRTVEAHCDVPFLLLILYACHSERRPIATAIGEVKNPLKINLYSAIQALRTVRRDEFATAQNDRPISIFKEQLLDCALVGQTLLSVQQSNRQECLFYFFRTVWISGTDFSPCAKSPFPNFSFLILNFELFFHLRLVMVSEFAQDKQKHLFGILSERENCGWKCKDTK